MLKAFSPRSRFGCNNLIKYNNFLFKNMTDAANLENGNGLKKENKNTDENEIANKKIKLDNQDQIVNNLNDINTTPASSEKSGIKKRKYALLIGYCGEGYFGLQR
jgi:hypothetical protein